jgi:uncharacterized protein YbjT (DUF2867 family)
MPPQTILVYGASGLRGRPIAQTLLTVGVQVRALVPTETEAADLQSLGVQTIIGTLDDVDSLRAASARVDAVFLQLPISSPSRHAKNAIDAARDAGVMRLVFTSNAPLPLEVTDVPAIEDVREVHAHLAQSGVPYVALRPMFYLENFAGPWTAPGVRDRNELAYPIQADVRVPWISIGDAAKLAVAALTHPSFTPAIFDIGGSENLSGDEVARRFSSVLGRQIRYVPVPLDEFEANLNAALGPGAGTVVTKIYHWLAAHPDASTATDVTHAPRNYGLELTPLEAWVRMHATIFTSS